MTYQIKNLSKSYDQLQVLDKLNLSFPEQKVTCILGPSGSGKTTLLKLLCGLQTPDSGEILGFDNALISMAFQEDRLIPWLSVFDNLHFVLKDKLDKKQSQELIRTYLKRVGLQEYAHYYPRDLSGGMKGRISILRAFVYPSQLLLMDEPFTSLDMATKKILMEFFKELIQQEKRTCILVTHNVDEAMELGDQIVVLSQKPAQVKAVFENPKTGTTSPYLSSDKIRLGHEDYPGNGDDSKDEDKSQVLRQQINALLMEK